MSLACMNHHFYESNTWVISGCQSMLFIGKLWVLCTFIGFHLRFSGSRYLKSGYFKIVDSLSDAKWSLLKFCGQMNKNECQTKNLKTPFKTFKFLKVIFKGNSQTVTKTQPFGVFSWVDVLGLGVNMMTIPWKTIKRLWNALKIIGSFH